MRWEDADVIAGVFVVPLFSWYNPEFDTEDPLLDTNRWILFNVLMQSGSSLCRVYNLQVSGHAVPT